MGDEGVVTPLLRRFFPGFAGEGRCGGGGREKGLTFVIGEGEDGGGDGLPPEKIPDEMVFANIRAEEVDSGVMFCARNVSQSMKM